MIEITCQALLFDLDGVLIDSTPAVRRVWSRWAEERGFDPAEVVAHAHGRPSIATVRKYLPMSDHEAENREVERRETTDVGGVVLLGGAGELLESLPRDRWTIVTSCTRPLCQLTLEDFARGVARQIWPRLKRVRSLVRQMFRNPRLYDSLEHNRRILKWRYQKEHTNAMRQNRICHFTPRNRIHRHSSRANSDTRQARNLKYKYKTLNANIIICQ